MTYKLYATDFFEKRLKKLSRKYPRIFQDYTQLISSLKEDPYQGKQLQDCEGPIFKVRMVSSDMKRGKSGGFRIIYLIQKKSKSVFLLTVYSKSEQENIESKIINKMLKSLNFAD